METIRYEDVSPTGEESLIALALNRKERNLTLEAYYRIFSESSFFVSGGRTEYLVRGPPDAMEGLPFNPGLFRDPVPDRWAGSAEPCRSATRGWPP